jgi:hypothetical protein
MLLLLHMSTHVCLHLGLKLIAFIFLLQKSTGDFPEATVNMFLATLPAIGSLAELPPNLSEKWQDHFPLTVVAMGLKRRLAAEGLCGCGFMFMRDKSVFSCILNEHCFFLCHFDCVGCV